MLYYDRLVISEGINVNKIIESKECDTCHYWYLLDKGSKFQQDVYYSCHDVLMMLVNLNHIAILNIHSSDYQCIISEISKREDVNLLQNLI